MNAWWPLLGTLGWNYLRHRRDPLVSLYLTVEDDRLEVRFRDHGAHQWVGLGDSRVWTWPL